MVADRVLVSGSSGWLGRALVRALLVGLADVPSLRDSPSRRTLRVLDLAHPPAHDVDARGRLERLRGDLREPADCDRLCRGGEGAVLFHTAGVIHPRRTRELYRVNVEGTGNLLAAAARAGVRRAVLVSSNSPLGCNPHPDHRFDEESPYHPYMHYGRSKMQMERLARRFAAETKLETVIVRAPWFYGPFQPPRQTLFFRMIRDGRVPVVGGGENERSMAYVDNLCQGLLLAADSPAAGSETYWIADERPYTMNEIIETVERLLESEFGQRCRHARLRLPGFAADLARGADRGIQALGLYHQKLHVLSEMNQTIACSIQKARDELGYAPTVALEEGMRRSIAHALTTQGAL